LTALPKHEEDQLLLSIAVGDEPAFSRIYCHYQPMVYPYVLKLVKVPALAEDVVQDIFVKIWEVRQQLPRVKYFPAFLFSIARNHTLNILQSVSRSNHALATLIRQFQEQRVDDEALSKDYRQFVERALLSIPLRSREIFHKCREQAMTYEEVAAEMGISRNAVKKHMVTAIRVLRESAQRDLGISLEACLVLISCLSFSFC
jgi:RNA polymerase sigma-70 factor (family 1)